MQGNGVIVAGGIKVDQQPIKIKVAGISPNKEGGAKAVVMEEDGVKVVAIIQISPNKEGGAKAVETGGMNRNRVETITDGVSQLTKVSKEVVGDSPTLDRIVDGEITMVMDGDRIL